MNASLTRGKNNVNNKIRKTTDHASEHEKSTIIANASTSRRAKSAGITAQLSITSCKELIARIMW